MTLIYDLDLDRVKLNHRAKCLRQRSFCCKVIIRTHTDTHTHTADRLHHKAAKTVGESWLTTEQNSLNVNIVDLTL